MASNISQGHRVPIIAFDFDGTLCHTAKFPKIGDIRKYAKEVTNFLHDIGVHITIWTCRSKSDDGTQDHIAPIVEWMNSNDIKFHDINTCVVPAGFSYESRKIFAHMYVDDRGFGWFESDMVLIIALAKFLEKVIGLTPAFADAIIHDLIKKGKVDEHRINTIRTFMATNW